MQKTVEIEIGSSLLKIETHRWAKQSNGSAVLTYKDNIILVTANMKDEVKEDQDFLPLMVDFRENTYAAGKIPGGFFKREGKPSEKEVLLSRLIDRPVRSLFPDNYFNETQVIALLLSADFSVDYDAMGIIGASASLLSSTIPFSTPLAAVKIGWKEGEFFVNPGQDVIREMQMQVLVAGTEDKVVMLEASGIDFSEEVALEGIRKGMEVVRTICQAQKELINPDKVPLLERREWKQSVNEIVSRFEDRIRDAVFCKDRVERNRKIDLISEELLAGKEDEKEISGLKSALHEAESRVFRSTLLKEQRRTDERAFDEIRPISIELGVLPRVHGSAVFTRGETQSLATITLGSEDDAQRLDLLNGEETSKRFMLHYNFPPFSVGEVSFLRGAGRREIGHGNLAEKSLVSVIPDKEKFPYTIRVVSDILESNGSSSMASVCGGTLALMNAGVPVRAPVAGIAMGLVQEGDEYRILTDIAGYEDHFGDMDFKVAGTREGITAIQLDIKIDGLIDEIVANTLADAKKARLFILEKMYQAIPAPSEKLSAYAPEIVTMEIVPDRIKDLIGPGGKTIKELTASYGVKINVEQDGKVSIAAPNQDVGLEVVERIKALTGTPDVGRIYSGRINRIEDYGIFVEIMPSVTGLVHISEVAYRRVHERELRKMFRMGQQVDVKVLALEKDGKMRLSVRAAQKQEEGENQENVQESQG